MVHVVAVVAVHVAPPGFDVTKNDVIGSPFEEPAVQETVTAPFPAVPVTLIGAAGADAGVTAFESADDTLTPLSAITLKT
jgi:hypothetical protein